MATLDEYLKCEIRYELSLIAHHEEAIEESRTRLKRLHDILDGSSDTNGCA
jgi:hypothetical protein